MSTLAYLKGCASASIAYPIAERLEKRNVRTKIRELRLHYSLPFAERRRLAMEGLAQILEFAGEHVPYYRDLFSERGFIPDSVRRDPRYLQELPNLTKDIILEQGPRLLSCSLEGLRHHACKTGGSTGPSCVIYYDQEAADYSSAVTRFARERIGKQHHMPELHFSSRFPDVFPLRDRVREYFKCLAMNRSNIVFDRLDDYGLEQIWSTLLRRRPHLVHAHPSTIHALARYVEQRYGNGHAFTIFESSGELLAPQVRKTIGDALRCIVVDRYGLAEFGIIAYELGPQGGKLQVLESEGWPECLPLEDTDNGEHELVFTGFRNRLMPLVRYRTGDLARVQEMPDGFFLVDVVGRIHDMVPINGVSYPTHYIQDVLDRVGGIQEFQIDLRSSPPVLRLVPEAIANPDEIRKRLNGWWKGGFQVRFVGHQDFVKVGYRAKFRHVVPA